MLFCCLNSNLTSLFHPTNITETQDVNEIVTPGIYKQLLSQRVPNGPGFWTYLMVFTWINETGNDTLTQVAIGYNVEQIAIRTCYEGTWTNWKNFVTDSALSVTQNNPESRINLSAGYKSGHISFEDSDSNVSIGFYARLEQKQVVASYYDGTSFNEKVIAQWE